MTTETLRRTALYEEHVALGARLVGFGGFEMPVQYSGIIREHDAVRNKAGIFDLSHMAQYELWGAGAAEWADRLTVNNVASMKPFQARYNLFCNAHGGTMDDVLFYRLPDRLLLVCNASNARKMWDHLNAENSSGDVKLVSKHGTNALIAVQGPRAVEIVAPLADIDVASLKYYFCEEGAIDGVAAVIARTGYTGEDGFELFVEGHEARRLWRRLLDAGAALGLEPAGLGARDMLRLEAGMPLYGFELSEDISPLAGGQSWAVKLNKPEFIGKEPLQAQAAADDYARIAGIVMEGRVPARHDYPVFAGNERVGVVKSASVAPSCGNRNIATVLVPKQVTAVGTRVRVEIRGSHQDAEVVSLPFYKRK